MKKIGRPKVLFEEDPLARGMWDPQEKMETDKWWESSKHQLSFINALREVMGLDPLVGEGCYHCARMKTMDLCSAHRKKNERAA